MIIQEFENVAKRCMQPFCNPPATLCNLLQPSALLKSYHTKAKNSWFTFEYEGCKKVAKGCTDRFALGTRVAKRLQKVAKHHVIFSFCFEGIAHIIPWILGGITPTGTLPKKQQIQSYLRGLYGKPLGPLISSRGLYGKENRTVDWRSIIIIVTDVVFCPVKISKGAATTFSAGNIMAQKNF